MIGIGDNESVWRDVIVMTGDDEYGYGMGDRESEKRVSLIVGVN